MSLYAENTTVTVSKSRQEIESTLRRYGADGFVAGYDGLRAFVMFRAHERYVKFIMEMPPLESFAITDKGRKRDKASQRQAFEKEERRRWRALHLGIKAKLEAVESEIGTFEQEFLAYIVLPDGGRVGDTIAPNIAAAYDTGEMPALMPGGE